MRLMPQNDVRKQIERSDRIIIVMNIGFGIFLLTWFIVISIGTEYNDYLYTIDLVNKVFPAAVLIYSINKLKI